MDNFWKGSIAPTAKILKHRDGCGNIENHIIILNIDVETEKDGTHVAHATMTWEGHEEEGEYVYDFEVDSPEFDDQDVAIAEIAAQASSA